MALIKSGDKKLQQYDHSALVKDVEAMRLNLMSISKAVEAYHVPNSTICELKKPN